MMGAGFSFTDNAPSVPRWIYSAISWKLKLMVPSDTLFVVASKQKVGTVNAVHFEDEDEDIRAESYMRNGSIAIELG